MGSPEECDVCPEGTFCPVGTSEAVPCAPGTFNNVSEQEICVRCEAGTYAPTDGAATCSDCPTGTYLSDASDYETEHDSRKRQIAMQDPVHTIVLKDYVQSQVNTMARQLGETNYKEIINNVDIETRDNLMEYVSL